MRNLIAALALMTCAGLAQAQTGKAPWEEFDRRIKASEKVAPLGNNAFGDEVSLSNGALSFSATDVSLPGNSGLPVSVGRKYTVRDRRYQVTDAMFADWDIALPHVSGVFAPDWLTSGGGTNRCSSSSGPPQTGGIVLTDFWQGTTLNIPGQSGGEMLITNAGTTKPSTGGPWLWIAGNQVHVSCLSTIKNGTGEGFLAVTPDGTRYWFDQMAQYQVPELRHGSVRQTDFTWIALHIQRRKNVLYATRVEDRFGNWVTYSYSNNWNQPGRLTAINSSDSRQLTLTYNGNGHVTSVSDGSRTWSYTYANANSGRRTLTSVTLPDASQWVINFAAFTNAEIEYTEVFAPGENYRTCSTLEIPLNYASEPTATITHPAGVVGTFTVNIKEHGRSKVTLNCSNIQYPTNDRNDDINLFPISYHGFTLKTKQVSGPGITTAAWNYAYVSGKSIHMYPGTTMFGNPVCVPWNSSMGVPFYDCWAPPCTNAACAGSSVTTVTGPNNEWTRYTYGNTFRYDEGKLKKVESGTGPSNILRTATNTYDLSMVNQAYPAKYGTSRQVNYDGFQEELHRPQLTSSIVQQGVTFNWQATEFDYYARATKEIRASSLPHSRTDHTTFHDNTAKWVIGQVANTYNVDELVYTSQTEYDATTALPLRFYVPGKTLAAGILAQTLTYNANGTIATAKDGRNNVTTLGNWYRGVPRTIGFADATTRSATVSAVGFVTSVTDENGFTTTYGYDALGRMTSLAHPTGDSVAWTATSIAYAKVASTEYGIPAGHWRQTVTRGNYRKEIYFDALWRPVIEREYDNAAVTATQRFTGWKYDHEGRVSFAGYPRATATGIASFTEGTTSVYDALGRPTSVTQTTEYGDLATLYAYLNDFKTRVTNPRTYETETAFQAFDRPDTSAPTQIIAARTRPEQQTTQIARNTLGNTLSLARSGTYGGVNVSATRHYVYDDHQRLCKRVEPETGATWLDYDAAGNVAWSAEGSGLTSLSCVRTTVPAGEKILRTYDARNRLTLVDYPTGTNDVSTSYYADGAVQSVTTGSVTTEYTYNKRRMLISERLLFGSLNWLTQYGYTALGDPATLTYRDGHQVSFAPNALGQATQAGPYATGASYFPNGALKQFTFGNGLVHTLTQNTRQLPDRSRTALGTNVVLDDSYDFDYNGNVAAISDALPGAPGDRTMSYDALDRLTGVTAGTHQGGNATFAYDPLDNLRSADQGTRQYRYHYHASTGRLDSLKTPGGTTLFNFTYDVRGNQVSKGLPLPLPTDTFTFDRANRITSANVGGTSTYIYDGLGRRVREISGGASTYFQYGQAGQLLYTNDLKTSLRHNHIHFAGSLVAKRTVPFSGGAATITYQHTDALGSPVAETNSAAVVTRRERMTAYGEPADGSYENGPGFTGHQTDAATKLVYMQQRYYDPTVGRFLSVDPMPSDTTTGWNFNRYNYAANSPYKFKDPDGRAIRHVGDGLAPSGSPECNTNPACRYAKNDGNSNSHKIDPVVKNALRDAMRASNPEADPIDRREQGFYYGTEPDGSIGTRSWPEGTFNSITPPGVDSDGKYQGLEVRGEGHSHPHRSSDRNPHTGNRFSTRANFQDKLGVKMSRYTGESYVIHHGGIDVLSTEGKTIGRIPIQEVFGDSDTWWRDE